MPPAAERRIVVALLSLLLLVLCVSLCGDGVRLALLGLPWQSRQADLPPGLPPGSTGPAPQPFATATLRPAGEEAPRLPTATRLPVPVNRLPPGQVCEPDRVQVETVEPQPGATLEIGSGQLAVLISFCLHSAPWAELLIVLVPSQSQPQSLPLGAPVIVQLGDGRYTQLLDWSAAPWSPDLAGGYRIAASLNAADDGRLLASGFAGEYFFVAP